MLLLYYAAELLGPEYNSFNVDWFKTLETLGDSCWDDMTWEYPLIENWSEPANVYFFESDSESDEWDNHMIAAYFYSFGKASDYNGKTIFDYDEPTNSMRIKDELTYEEAVISAMRLYDSIQKHYTVPQILIDEKYFVYNEQIEKLIDDAKLRKEEILKQ